MATEAGQHRSAANSKAPRRPWWRLAVLAAGVLMILGGAGTWVMSVVTDPARLPLKTIRITGELSHIDRGRLQQLVAGAIDGGFFTVDMRKLRAAAEQLPWVDEVSIRRVWPQTLVMAVTEQVPLARWGDTALVNGRGEVFRPEGGELPVGLPLLEGDEPAAARMVDFYRQASRQLARAGRRVQRLRLTEQQDWRLQLDGGLVLVIGQRQAVEALERFVMAVPAIRDEAGRQPEQVDMRYENGFAVRWAPAGETNVKNQKQGDA